MPRCPRPTTPTSRLRLALTAADVADRAEMAAGAGSADAAVRRARPAARRARRRRDDPLGRRLAAPAPLVLPGDPQPRRVLPDGAGRARPGRGTAPRRRRRCASRTPHPTTYAVAGCRSAAAGSPTTCSPTGTPLPRSSRPASRPAARARTTSWCSRGSATSATTPTTTATWRTRASAGGSRPPRAPGPATSAARSPRRCCWPSCSATRATRPAPGPSPTWSAGGPPRSAPAGVAAQAEGFLAGVDPTRAPEEERVSSADVWVADHRRSPARTSRATTTRP